MKSSMNGGLVGKAVREVGVVSRFIKHWQNLEACSSLTLTMRQEQKGAPAVAEPFRMGR